MKNYILLTSLATAGLATVLGLVSVATHIDGLLSSAVMIGLFSFCSYIVGFAYPSTVVETQTAKYDETTQTNTRTVVNN